MRGSSHSATASQGSVADVGSVPTEITPDIIATNRRSCWNIAAKSKALLLEDDTMEMAEQFTAQREVKNHDAMILLGYLIFAIVLLIAIYFDSMSSGTALVDFASMTVFP
jgi:hypothetical protein